jgi:transaldolase/glucose-6-phosphate isomerase
VFLIVTAAPEADFPVPGQVYSFGVLEQAQAAGDFAALDAARRRALLVHLPGRDPKLVQRLSSILLGAS